MKPPFRLSHAWLAGAAAIALAACSAEGPNQGPLGPAFEVTPGDLTIAVQVCKVGNDAQTLGNLFTFNASAVGPTVGGSVVTVTTPVQSEARALGAPGDCKVVWVRTNASFDDESEVTVTEVVPAGYHLDQISFTGTGHPSEVVPSAIIDPASPSVTFKPYGGMTVLFKNSFVEEPPGGEGCTPGYWKTHTGLGPQANAWPPTGYTQNQLISSVFAGAATYAGSTLLEALDFGGGSGVNGARRILLRAAVAGLLNTAHPGVNYPTSTADLISAVNTALASNDRATMLALASSIDTDNNLGCPL